MDSMQSAVLAQALVPWDTSAPAKDNGQSMRPHPKRQQHTHAASTQRLHQKSARLEACRPSEPACIRAKGATHRSRRCWYIRDGRQHRIGRTCARHQARWADCLHRPSHVDAH